MLISVVVIFCLTGVASAHVPYIERNDYSEENPFYVWKMIEISKAFYAWLEPVDTGTDVDVFLFKVGKKPVNIYAELIVPVVDDYYEDFVPWFALLGPDLPSINQTVPFTIPAGYGGIIMENVDPGEPRETFFEPFGGKSYYEGPVLDETLSTTGEYYLCVWDPFHQGGDYVFTIGKGEFFGPVDIIRAIINTIIIRTDGELHVPTFLLI